MTVVPFGRALLNSVIISSTCTIGVLLTSLMAGYVFAKIRFRGRDGLFWATVATMFIPPAVTLVPLYRMIAAIGLSDNLAGVILPWLANAFGIFLMRQFIKDFPDELLEAARVDGAGEFRIVFRIVAPLLKPALVTLGVFAFVFDWNAFIWPLSVLSSPDKHPIVLVLNSLSSLGHAIEYRNVIIAGSLLASLPTILVFFVFQRFFVQGMARSGIK
jgi:multiple sugar transport system permease protein